MTTRIKLTENIETRDARMWQRFMASADAFEMHVTLIMWQDNVDNGPARIRAWSEGPNGLGERADRGGIGTYQQKVAMKVDERGF